MSLLGTNRVAWIGGVAPVMQCPMLALPMLASVTGNLVAFPVAEPGYALYDPD